MSLSEITNGVTDERQQPDSLAEANIRHRKRSIRSKQPSGSPICDQLLRRFGQPRVYFKESLRDVVVNSTTVSLYTKHEQIAGDGVCNP